MPASSLHRPARRVKGADRTQRSQIRAQNARGFSKVSPQSNGMFNRFRDGRRPHQCVTEGSSGCRTRADITKADLSGLELAGVDRARRDARSAMTAIAALGRRHAALFDRTQAGAARHLRKFQAAEGSRHGAALRLDACCEALGWSHLCLLSHGDTWFRDNRVYGYFDRLIDDGFFDEFEQVIFYGAGACGYAAAAFSVAAPGAKRGDARPQATLDPRVAEWDDRYLHMRRTRSPTATATPPTCSTPQRGGPAL